jgi:hypothetical protein
MFVKNRHLCMLLFRVLIIIEHLVYTMMFARGHPSILFGIIVKVFVFFDVGSSHSIKHVITVKIRNFLRSFRL